MRHAPSFPPHTFWCVRYLLRGDVLAEVEVEAKTEAQALAIVETKGLVSPRERRLADAIKVERLSEPQA